ncbi:cAMP-dependent protein kinase inhibitor alpha-like [Petromyzon marinus]|uniref:cAMP-dependent protein kinase inhibitor alpha-like n=1 Tax=Petromyzon marinus TaxID=7757 RepID=UPI003A603DE7
MTDVEEAFAEFVASGRSGRRNALPDILGSPSGSTNPELPLQLSELSIKSDEGSEAQSPSAEAPSGQTEGDKKDGST